MDYSIISKHQDRLLKHAFTLHLSEEAAELLLDIVSYYISHNEPVEDFYKLSALADVSNIERDIVRKLRQINKWKEN